MRRVAINKLIQMGFQVEQSDIVPSDLEEADEIFFTNSVQGVAWVSSYAKKRYFKKVSSKLIEQL